MDQAIRDCACGKVFEKWTVVDHLVLTAKCVEDAWYQFCIEKQNIVKRAFSKSRLSVSIDGS